MRGLHGSSRHSEAHLSHEAGAADRIAPGAGSLRRLWAYQRERFPFVAYASMVAATGFSALAFSAQLRGAGQLPRAGSVLVGCGSAFLFFVEMRVLDEFKDLEDDTRFRPYRPVPRGLVTLRELAAVGLTAAALQLVFALLLDPALLPLLVGVWAYLGLMAREFFVRDWLRAHLATYTLTHNPILPLIFLYVTACDWRLHAAFPPVGLLWLLAVTAFGGIVFEVGRKIRVPQDEETGVATYSMAWGRLGAVAVWYTGLVGLAVSALGAAGQVHFVGPTAVVMATLLVLTGAVAVSVLRSTQTGAGKRIDNFSGVAVPLVFLCIGTAPLVIH